MIVVHALSVIYHRTCIKDCLYISEGLSSQVTVIVRTCHINSSTLCGDQTAAPTRSFTEAVFVDRSIVLTLTLSDPQVSQNCSITSPP